MDYHSIFVSINRIKLWKIYSKKEKHKQNGFGGTNKNAEITRTHQNIGNIGRIEDIRNTGSIEEGSLFCLFLMLL